MRIFGITMALGILLSTVGCGDPNDRYSDPELLGYVDDFYAYCEAYELPCKRKVKSINFADVTPYGHGGTCSSGHILIDDQFKDQKMFAVRLIVYHELGHCVLKLDHVDSDWSIMRPALHGEHFDWIYSQRWGVSPADLWEILKLDMANQALN